MEPKPQRFFVALVPPPEIQAIVDDIKRQFAEEYASQAAQKSPPHITLQPPFAWMPQELPKVEEQLAKFSMQQTPFEVELNGFAAFPPRVIYVDVVKPAALLNLQTSLMADLEATLEIVHEASKRRSFTPHMTVASQDLTPPNFNAAWQSFQERSLQIKFLASSLSLLIHDEQWHIHKTFPLSKKVHSP
ncbi:2'-5' RNA ligase family protein [Phormidium sp. CLA17]|uniref:2'-5' RNA ligase family protein n=1 Tax=Leptolyngbya sp. Cla-17 TaxID=2803751 RepID=UPI001491B02D|nr:2'-5' RNA ligase family protein [Leptolyngbya sp. Cla-17]MBM0742116.1 2'-5' RNA ligase family protein [Leptolyngbya sp. Cla-17]